MVPDANFGGCSESENEERLLVGVEERSTDGVAPGNDYNDLVELEIDEGNSLPELTSESNSDSQSIDDFEYDASNSDMTDSGNSETQWGNPIRVRCDQDALDMQVVIGISDSSEPELFGWGNLTTESDESQHPSDDGIGLGRGQGDARNEVAAQVNEYADDILLLERFAHDYGMQIEVVAEELRPQSDLEDNGSVSSGDTRDGGARASANAADLVEDLATCDLEVESDVTRDVLGEVSVETMDRIQANVMESTVEEACPNSNISYE